MSDKLRDKKKNYKISEEEYSHPRHEPYKRERLKWDELEDYDEEEDDAAL